MNILGIVKVMWADILQVSVASPFPGAASCEWRRENGRLLTEDLDGCLDCEEYRKAMISYSWLRAAEIVGGMLEGCVLIALGPVIGVGRGRGI
jgi:hypothetical protein